MQSHEQHDPNVLRGGAFVTNGWENVLMTSSAESLSEIWKREKCSPEYAFNIIPGTPGIHAVPRRARLVFTNTLRNVPWETSILDARGISPIRQGEDLRFTRLMEGDVAFLNPEEYAAFLATQVDFSDEDTYPEEGGALRLEGLTPTHGVPVADGQRLYVDEADHPLGSYYRIRSVIR